MQSIQKNRLVKNVKKSFVLIYLIVYQVVLAFKMVNNLDPSVKFSCTMVVLL